MDLRTIQYELVDNFELLAREIYGEGIIPLHRPLFEGREVEMLRDCIESNFVSSVGKQVNAFEDAIANFTGSLFSVATVNGTSALHAALLAVGVRPEDEVITQALTFVATANSISYTGATPVFVDVDIDTLGMSAQALKNFLVSHAEKKPSGTYNRNTGRRISACVPMHTLGIPCRIRELASICEDWGLALVEDCAESLGSKSGSLHTGKYGACAIFSFNGNKIITTGGGGMIITDSEDLANTAKHLTTTAKLPHPYEFQHDEIGFNYRLPNLNATLGMAQFENLESILTAKKSVAEQWRVFFIQQGIPFLECLPHDCSNNWLSGVILPSKADRDFFLKETNARGIMTRPLWNLMTEMDIYRGCESDALENSRWLQDRVVNIPTSAP